jgi:hypothetical protein
VHGSRAAAAAADRAPCSPCSSRCGQRGHHSCACVSDVASWCGVVGWGGARVRRTTIGERATATMVRVNDEQRHLGSNEQLCLWTAEELLLPAVLRQQCGGQRVEQQGAGGAWSGGNVGGVQAVLAAAAARAVCYIAAAAAAVEASTLLCALRSASGPSRQSASLYGSSWDWHSIHHYSRGGPQGTALVWCC